MGSCEALWKTELGDVPRNSKADPYCGLWEDPDQRPTICTSLSVETHLGFVKAIPSVSASWGS